MLDAVQRGDRILDAFGNFNLDFRRTGSLVFAADQHGRNLHVGQEVDADFRIKTDADHDQHDDECGHRNRTLYGPLAQKHGCAPPLLLIDCPQKRTVVDEGLTRDDKPLFQQFLCVDHFAVFPVDDAPDHIETLGAVAGIHGIDNVTVVGAQQERVRRKAIRLLFLKNETQIAEHSADQGNLFRNQNFKLEGSAFRINAGRLVRDTSPSLLLPADQKADRGFCREPPDRNRPR